MWALWKSVGGLGGRSPGVTYVYETQTKTNIAVLFVLFVIVVCYDWVLTHIVSAITFAEPKKVDDVFSVLPVCRILRRLGEVIFLCVIL